MLCCEWKQLLEGVFWDETGVNEIISGIVSCLTFVERTTMENDQSCIVEDINGYTGIIERE